jgi:hypothetical protein
MPTSRSPRPSAKSPPAASRARFVRPLLAIAAAAILAVAVIALPASLLQRLLPPFISAGDFSGSLWHGSAGRITDGGRELGAVEWRLHPLALLGLTVSADVHWVKVGFVADGKVSVERRAIAVRDFEGDGPLADLHDFGVPPEWSGTASFKFSELRAVFTDGGVVPVAAVGDVSVADLASLKIANGANLGGYVLHVADGNLKPAGDATAELSDTGGPLQVQAMIHFTVKSRTGLISGTVRERDSAPAALRELIVNLEQLNRRDTEGRIPVELEFTM